MAWAALNQVVGSCFTDTLFLLRLSPSSGSTFVTLLAYLQFGFHSKSTSAESLRWWFPIGHHSQQKWSICTVEYSIFHVTPGSTPKYPGSSPPITGSIRRRADVRKYYGEIAPKGREVPQSIAPWPYSIQTQFGDALSGKIVLQRFWEGSQQCQAKPRR